MIHETARVHPLAHVDGAEIGARSTVWQFASLTRGTRLGEDCSVAPGAALDGPWFGDRCRIGHHVAMGPGFRFGDDCFIGPGVVLCNDAWPTTERVGWDIERFQNGFVTIRVGNKVGIGANAVILPGVVIGEGAFIAAGAVCGRNVPAGHLFKRDGTIVEINTAWTKRRMRAAA